MEFSNDIAAFVAEVLKTILGFFKGTENELTEDELTGIQNFVNLIFML